jgi:hypothetical protein
MYERKDVQVRWDEFVEDLTAWFNDSSSRHTTIESKCHVEGVAKRHGVSVDVSFDSNNKMTVNVLGDLYGRVIAVTTCPDSLRIKNSYHYDRLVLHMNGLYSKEPALARFLENRCAKMVKYIKPDIITRLDVCEVGNTDDEARFDLEMSKDHYGHYSKIFEFKHKKFGTVTHITKYKIGFNYGD